MTETYDRLSAEEKREVRSYGVTVAGMVESIENRLHPDPAMMVCSMLSDAQEMLACRQEGDVMVDEDIRQLLNRAKFIIFNYLRNIEP